ncbi:uncharacterized protein LOC132702259 [Cylas formicarius]|uniref:uncharacterized protein LOC132702259 n=1 Tax=Cylas formicarius TaxID=197179 RepID=UPI002958BCC7|nr:uncharacterized protein LOC132702259 [Cylas formicarius]
MASSDNHPNIIVGDEIDRLVDASLGELLLNLLQTHEKNVILVDAATNEELQADALLAKGIRLAKWFKNLGLGIGDSISVTAENRLEFAIVPVGTFFVGATFAPFNPDYTPAEVKHVLGLSKPKVVFCSEKTINKLLAALPNHPHILKLVLFGNKRRVDKNIVMFEDIIQGPFEFDESFQPPPLDMKETVATILCSSGTTGLPKGVMCTHDNMAAFIDIGRTRLAHIAESEGDDAMMGLTPFFHSFGFMLMFLNILRGKKMVVLSKFHVKFFLDAIIKYNLKRLIVPPPVLLILLKHPLVKQYDLSGIEEIRSGAAALGKDMQKELKEKFKVKMISQAYGMTETTLGVLMAHDGNTKLGSVGRIVPGMKVKVIDESNVPLGPNCEGELCFKGPLIMKGYVGDVQATSATIDPDGWLHTGDIAYYDEDRDFFIVDRIKELIKYKGFQVAPAELENLLLTHPSVKDAAVTGLPDEIAEELPLAFIVKDGHHLTEEEVVKYVADNVSDTKRLRGGVVFVDEIPRNPTGKILRRVLKQRARHMAKLKSKL